MSTSKFHTIRVGETGSWYELPVGAFIENWRQQKKKNIKMSPLSHGGINTADRKYKPQVLIVACELFENTTAALKTAVVALVAAVEGKEGLTLEVYDEEAAASADEWVFDELNDIEIVWTSYSKRKVAVVRLELDCLSAPYLVGTVT
jgi:hypothetical protein